MKQFSFYLDNELLVSSCASPLLKTVSAISTTQHAWSISVRCFFTAFIIFFFSFFLFLLLFKAYNGFYRSNDTATFIMCQVSLVSPVSTTVSYLPISFTWNVDKPYMCPLKYHIYLGNVNYHALSQHSGTSCSLEKMQIVGTTNLTSVRTTSSMLAFNESGFLCWRVVAESPDSFNSSSESKTFFYSPAPVNSRFDKIHVDNFATKCSTSKITDQSFSCK